MIQRRNYLGLYEPAGRPSTAPYREDMHRLGGILCQPVSPQRSFL